jgi:hypothetical protein
LGNCLPICIGSTQVRNAGGRCGRCFLRHVAAWRFGGSFPGAGV